MPTDERLIIAKLPFLFVENSGEGKGPYRKVAVETCGFCHWPRHATGGHFIHVLLEFSVDGTVWEGRPLHVRSLPPRTLRPPLSSRTEIDQFLPNLLPSRELGPCHHAKAISLRDGDGECVCCLCPFVGRWQSFVLLFPPQPVPPPSSSSSSSPYSFVIP